MRNEVSISVTETEDGKHAYRVVKTDLNGHTITVDSTTHRALQYLVDPTDYDPNLELVAFMWDNTKGHCNDCGNPAAYYLTGIRGGFASGASLRCSVCAAEAAAGGETIARIPDYKKPEAVRSNPRWTTDYERGLWYLGQWERNEGRQYRLFDLWWKPEEPTVIARYGNNGEDYFSGLEGVGGNLALTLAFTRAVKHGLIPLTDPQIASRIR